MFITSVMICQVGQKKVHNDLLLPGLHSHNLHQGAEFCSQLDDDIGYGAEDEDDDHGDDDHDDDDHDDDDHDDDNHDSTAAEFCSRVPTCAATLL